MTETEHDQVRQRIRQSYAEVARSDDIGCGCDVPTSCCGTTPEREAFSERLGYTREDLAKAPGGADMGLGCGNPKAIAALKPGEVAVDLGAGGGFDCFLTAHEVGKSGRVIGIDMTPDMLSKARSNAANGGFDNIEFRLGEIEHLPLADASADVVLSNCVINLSPNKAQVFREAFRVLKPGGRLAISDVVASCPLPDEIREDKELLSACISGASTVDELGGYIIAAGFEQNLIEPKDESRVFIREWAPGRGIEEYVLSATIEAVKPAI